MGSKKINKAGETEPYSRKFKAIPYYAWAHSGKEQMKVWIPVSEDYSAGIHEWIVN
jgi:DUF1680 family protein